MDPPAWLRPAIAVAGVGQLAIAAGSLAIPRVLRWREDVAKLRPLTRQVFWTYAGYVWGTNVAFGLVSTLASERLTDGSPLATCVCGFVAAYWLARVLIQFLWFDRSDAPSGGVYVVAEVALVGSFVFFVVVYGYAAALGAGLVGGR